MDATHYYRYLLTIFYAAALGIILLFSCNHKAQALPQELSATSQKQELYRANTDVSLEGNSRVQQRAQIIASPTWVYLLLVFGTYLIFLEFMNPGMILPGILGALLLVSAFYFMQHLTVRYSGLLLLFLGLACILAEAVWLSYGALGLGGTIVFFFGSVMLFPISPLNGELSLGLIFAITAINLILLFVLVRMAIKARQLKVRHGLHLLLGMEGRALGPIHEQGQAVIRGEIWNVRASDPIAADAIIKVLDFDGLTLKVASKN